MMRVKNHIFLKLGIGIMILILAVLAPLSFSIHHFFERFYTNQVVSNLVARGQYVEKMLEVNGVDESSLNQTSAFGGTNSGLVVIGKHNRVIFNSGVPLDNMLNTKLISKLQQKQTFHQILGHWIVVGVPSHQKKWTGIFLYAPRQSLKDAIERFLGMIIWAGFGAILLGIGLTWAFSKAMVQPLLKMKETTESLSSGHFHHRVIVKGNDEIAQLGKAINDLSDELQRLQDSRKAFLSNVSHELRSPLSYIKGYSQALDEGMIKTKTDQEKFVKVIRKEAERMTRLVEDLFDLAQMDEGQLQLSKEVVNLDVIIQNMIETVKPQAEAKQIQVTYRPAISEPVVIGDAGRLSQVFFNLFDNAIRYAPDFGNITVITTVTRQDARVEISDNGDGIPSKQLPFIWDRFYRGDRSRSRKSGGTGLGLSIVKQIVEGHQGTVDLQSKKGMGTVLTVTIPLLKS